MKMIKENRIKKNITQEELAERVDISWRQLQRIEKDEKKTRVETLKKIILALDIPDDEILHYIKRKKQSK